MKKYSFLFILVLISFGCYLAARYAPGGLFPEVTPQTDTVVKTVVVPADPVLVEIETVIPAPELIDTGLIIYQQQIIDTLAILEDYFRTRKYADTLLNDTSYRIVWNAVVYQNRLHDFHLQHQNLRNRVEHYTTLHIHHRKLYGGGYFLAFADKSSVGLSASYTDQKNLYGLMIGTNKTYLFTWQRALLQTKYK